MTDGSKQEKVVERTWNELDGPQTCQNCSRQVYQFWKLIDILYFFDIFVIKFNSWLVV